MSNVLCINSVIYSIGVPMAKTAIFVYVGIVSMIMMQSVSGAKKSKLEVKGSATDLADKDGWTAGQSDPYMEVIAYNSWGFSDYLATPVRGGTNNPTWNDYLVFEETEPIFYYRMKIYVMDEDGGDRRPDQLCGPISIDLEDGEHTESFDCNPGKLTVQYKFSTPY